MLWIRGLFWQVLGAMLLLVGVTVGLTSLLTVRQTRVATSEIVSEVTRQVVAARAQQIGAWIDGRLAELSLLASSPVVGGADEYAVRAELARFARVRERDYQSVGVVGRGGTVRLSGGEVISIATRPYYQRLISEGRSWVVSEPIYSRSDAQPIVVLLVRCGDTIVSGAILLSWLSDIAARIEVRGVSARIIDRSGVPILPSEGRVRAGEGGERVVRIAAAIPRVERWRLVVDLPQSALYREANALVARLWVTFVVMGAVALGGAVWFSASLTRPIRRLQRLMFVARRGDLSVRAPARRRDEIGALEGSFNDLVGHTERLIGEIHATQRQVRLREIEGMLQQVKPHFLYNSLDSVRWMAVERGQGEIARVVEHLSEVFRLSLSGGSEDVSLERELRHVESYLAVQRVRYEGGFSYRVLCDAACKACRVLRLIVQPLVENALYHGVRGGDCDGEGEIEVRVMRRTRGGRPVVVIEVSDNGSGFREREKSGDGYGIRSVRERLGLSFGKPFGVEVERNGALGGATVRIVHPLMEG